MADERPTARIGIVTGERAPDLTDDDRALATELADRGYAVEPVLWDDPAVEWSDFDVLLLRSCWEYHTRPEAFQQWVASVRDAGVTVRNPPDVVLWNVHKFYLRDLERRGARVLPTVWVDRSSDVDLQTLLQSNGWEEAVVKPAVGTSSANVWRTSVSEAPARQEAFEALVADGDVLVQEFAPEILDGERSFVFFGGRFSHATRRVPADGDFRAHPNFGGTSRSDDPPAALVEQAAGVLQRACEHLEVAPSDLPYARVDGVERDGSFVLMELELVEPFLSLETADRAVTAFADAVETSLDATPPTTSRTDTRRRPFDE